MSRAEEPTATTSRWPSAPRTERLGEAVDVVEEDEALPAHPPFSVIRSIRP
ncbi:hypothetical protein GTY87_39105 [Streptomyces sp. SID7813]|uniref:Uncharacterized protein n=1 Tax=Streptomyces coelicolor (strain ATCC BAA-471 / A3(2) / M145) TaxID=100226 RepID=Q9F3M9_STRCO|nr:hypothetical protein [Streptomyces sp. SID7813]QFI47376.1 hypothetical protein FQ762_39470 [Streptomyces coelicolor A3(2)]THA85473.1 hypothetical protein E6R61_32080 [Streptomyces sp. LRa12]CAC16991.1 hypothetical protein SC10F4.31 [Streptomyces coelicolor A3(2)]